MMSPLRPIRDPRWYETPAGRFAICVAVLFGIAFAIMLWELAMPPRAGADPAQTCTDVVVEHTGGWWGKVDEVGDPATVTFTAPAGYLIDRYCVKAGSGEGAVVIVEVDPPARTVVIDHPTKGSVSHWIVHKIQPSTTSTTTAPSTTTTTEATTTTSTTTSTTASTTTLVPVDPPAPEIGDPVTLDRPAAEVAGLQTVADDQPVTARRERLPVTGATLIRALLGACLAAVGVATVIASKRTTS